jgi:TusA-related sulfurtransferase
VSSQFRNPLSERGEGGIDESYGPRTKHRVNPLLTKELFADHELDISGDTCPMTFVRTRLMLDRMRAGETLLLRVKGQEPRRNIPRTATEQGHAVLGLRDLTDGTAQLLLRKGG